MSTRPCPSCANPVPADFGFCGHCGANMRAAEPPPPPPPPPASPAPVATGSSRTPRSQSTGVQLVILRGPMPEGSTYDLRFGRNTVGRSSEIAFAADTSLDPEHLVLGCEGGHVDIVEVPGEGGAFRRIRAPASVASGDLVFAGEQYLVLRVGEHAPRESVDSSQGVPEETFGTPLPPPHLHVTQLLGRGLPGRVASTDKTSLSIGRENSDLSFPQDRFMSGRHVRVENQDGEIQVTDVGSLNGTFARVTEVPLRLSAGDEIMIGAVLFRVDFS